MKKILILSMSCNDNFFIEQENYVRNTWAKPIIEGKYPNINFAFYKGNNISHKYNKESNTLYIRCEDDLDNTFKKTYYTFSLINNTNLFEYDYIFRTNTSTFVNVELLNAFVQSLEDDNILWCSELYSLSEAYVPYPLNIYPRGNGILISKKLIDVIIKDGLNLLYLGIVDDVAIGNIINSYWIKQDKDYKDYIKSYTHGWYKCIGTKANNNNSLCNYYNENKNFDFVKNFVTIQIKRYWEREKENNNYPELWETFANNTNSNIQESINYIYEYSKNPNIFIGSILGYIDYKTWLNMSKSKLYQLETSYKAIDDIQRVNSKRILL